MFELQKPIALYTSRARACPFFYLVKNLTRSEEEAPTAMALARDRQGAGNETRRRRNRDAR